MVRTQLPGKIGAQPRQDIYGPCSRTGSPSVGQLEALQGERGRKRKAEQEKGEKDARRAVGDRVWERGLSNVNFKSKAQSAFEWQTLWQEPDS